jgi:hypothetical protein
MGTTYADNFGSEGKQSTWTVSGIFVLVTLSNEPMQSSPKMLSLTIMTFDTNSNTYSLLRPSETNARPLI